MSCTATQGRGCRPSFELPLRALSDSVVLLLLEAMFVVCNSDQKTYGHSESICPLTIKSKKATFAVILMNTGVQLRKGDMKDFCDNHYTPKHPCK